MNEKRRVLEALVAGWEEGVTPISVADLSGRLRADVSEVEQALSALHGYELVEATEEGYRPTTTGREFLALGIDEEPFVIVETPACHEGNGGRT